GSSRRKSRSPPPRKRTSGGFRSSLRPHRARRRNDEGDNCMNCQNHPDVPATAYCRSCGKAVCDECRRDAFGTGFCAEHAPAPASAPPPPPTAAPPPPVPPGAPGYVYADVSPGLALFLGMIPGVGAIYNGQYAKGLVHAIVFGVLCSLG